MRLGEGVVVADNALALEVARRGPEARAQVRQEYAAGTLDSVEAALTRFEELMTPTTAAREALRVVAASLRAAESALDLWADGGADFLRRAACLLGDLLALMRTLTDVGIEAPAELSDAVSMLGALATSVCGDREDS